MNPSEQILKQIEQVGYTCAVIREGDSLAVVAEPNTDIVPARRGPRRARQMVRIDGIGEDSRYRAVRQLAIQCGLAVE